MEEVEPNVIYPTLSITATIRITRMKSVYIMLPKNMRRLMKLGVKPVCHYHDGVDGIEIKAGDVVYSANKTRWRSGSILAHLPCAMKKSVVLPSDLVRKN
jgi:hypothetical protein